MRTANDHQRDTDHGQSDSNQRHSLHALESACSRDQRDKRRRGADNQRRVAGARARYSVHEEKLVQAVAEDTEQEKASDVSTGHREPASRERNQQQKTGRDPDAQAGECHGAEDVRCVLDHDEVDPPDHRHHEQENIGETESAMRGRVGNGWWMPN